MFGGRRPEYACNPKCTLSVINNKICWWQCHGLGFLQCKWNRNLKIIIQNNFMEILDNIFAKSARTVIKIFHSVIYGRFCSSGQCVISTSIRVIIGFNEDHRVVGEGFNRVFHYYLEISAYFVL